MQPPGKVLQFVEFITRLNEAIIKRANIEFVPTIDIIRKNSKNNQKLEFNEQ